MTVIPGQKQAGLLLRLAALEGTFHATFITFYRRPTSLRRKKEPPSFSFFIWISSGGRPPSYPPAGLLRKYVIRLDVGVLERAKLVDVSQWKWKNASGNKKKEKKSWCQKYCEREFQKNTHGFELKKETCCKELVTRHFFFFFIYLSRKYKLLRIIACPRIFNKAMCQFKREYYLPEAVHNNPWKSTLSTVNLHPIETPRYFKANSKPICKTDEGVNGSVRFSALLILYQFFFVNAVLGCFGELKVSRGIFYDLFRSFVGGATKLCFDLHTTWFEVISNLMVHFFHQLLWMHP